MFIGNAGTVIRPLTAALAFNNGEYTLHGNNRMSLMQMYIEARFEELKLWDVGLATIKDPPPGKEFTENEIISGKEFLVSYRGTGFLSKDFKVYTVNSSRRVAPGASYARNGLKKQQIDDIEVPSEVMYNFHREKPLLLIQIIKPQLTENNSQFKLFDSNCPTISVFFPGKSSVPIQEEIYFRNTVAKMIDEAEFEYDEDEETDFYQEI